MTDPSRAAILDRLASMPDAPTMAHPGPAPFAAPMDQEGLVACFERELQAVHGELCPELPPEGAVVVTADIGIADSGSVVFVDGWPSDVWLADVVVARLPRDQVVPSLADAWPRFQTSPRWLSVCGPSRTADIEKRLVLGAHGPRCFLVQWA